MDQVFQLFSAGCQFAADNAAGGAGESRRSGKSRFPSTSEMSGKICAG
jgi:hypothetical protein